MLRVDDNKKAKADEAAPQATAQVMAASSSSQHEESFAACLTTVCASTAATTTNSVLRALHAASFDHQATLFALQALQEQVSGMSAAMQNLLTPQASEPKAEPLELAPTPRRTAS
jgi:hypothetical protein